MRVEICKQILPCCKILCSKPPLTFRMPVTGMQLKCFECTRTAFTCCLEFPSIRRESAPLYSTAAASSNVLGHHDEAITILGCIMDPKIWAGREAEAGGCSKHSQGVHVRHVSHWREMDLLVLLPNQQKVRSTPQSQLLIQKSNGTYFGYKLFESYLWDQVIWSCTINLVVLFLTSNATISPCKRVDAHVKKLLQHSHLVIWMQCCCCCQLTRGSTCSTSPIYLCPDAHLTDYF